MAITSFVRRTRHLVALASLLPAFACSQTAWHRVVRISPGVPFRDVSANDDHFVAVGELGLVLTSSNGFDWVERDAGTQETLNQVTRFGDGFLAVGAAGTLFHSPDGITWSQRLAGPNPVGGIATNDTIAVAIGDHSNHAFYRSMDGRHWERVAVNFAADDIVFDGSRFVAHDFGPGRSLTSTDGRIWTEADVPFVTRANEPRLGNVAVKGQSVSVDGGDWQPIVVPASSTKDFIQGVAHGNGRWVVDSAYTSTDLVNWEAIAPLPVPEAVFFQYRSDWRRSVPSGTLTFAHDRFWAVRETGTPTGSLLWSSTDGQNFTIALQTPERLRRTIGHANGIYLLLSASSRSVLTSTDGQNWTTTPDAQPEVLPAAQPGGPADRRYIVGSETGFIMGIEGTGWFTSSNGINWMPLANSGASMPLDRIDGVSDHAGKLVAWTDQDVWTSSDNASTWTHVAAPPFQIQRAAYSGSRLVIAGAQYVATLGSEAVWNISPFPAKSYTTGIASSADATVVTMGDQVFVGRHDTGPTITAFTPTTAVTLADNELTDFAVAASAAQPLTYQWTRSGLDILGATSATLRTTLPADPHDNWNTIAVKVSDGTHIVTASLQARIVSSQPPALVETGLTSWPYFRADGVGYWSLQARFAGSLLTYQWYRDSQPIPGATSANLRVTANVVEAGHRFHVVGSNAFGTVASAPFVVTYPTITGGEVTTAVSDQDPEFITWLRVDASRVAHYQWRRNGQPIARATNFYYHIPFALPPPDAGGWSGFYDVVMSNAYGTVVSPVVRVQQPGDPTLPAVTPSYPAPKPTFTRLTNLSVRSPAGPGDQALVAGFVLDPSSQVSADRPTRLLLRAIGPGLAEFDVADPMPDPLLRVALPDETIVAENSAWEGSLSTAFTTVGAFGLAEGSRDAALLHSVAALDAPRVYTASVLPDGDAEEGEALFELYPLPDGNGTGLGNLSARAIITPERPLTAGFVISGDDQMTLLVRAVGDGLQNFGLTHTAAKPRIHLRALDGNTERVAIGHLPEADEAAARLGAFPLTSVDDTAARFTNLRAGRYTVTVECEDAGVVLLELYVDWRSIF